jgi:hypothetical protein
LRKRQGVSLLSLASRLLVHDARLTPLGRHPRDNASQGGCMMWGAASRSGQSQMGSMARSQQIPAEMEVRRTDCPPSKRRRVYGSASPAKARQRLLTGWQRPPSLVVGLSQITDARCSKQGQGSRGAVNKRWWVHVGAVKARPWNPRCCDDPGYTRWGKCPLLHWMGWCCYPIPSFFLPSSTT